MSHCLLWELTLWSAWCKVWQVQLPCQWQNWQPSLLDMVIYECFSLMLMSLECVLKVFWVKIELHTGSRSRNMQTLFTTSVTNAVSLVLRMTEAGSCVWMLPLSLSFFSCPIHTSLLLKAKGLVLFCFVVHVYPRRIYSQKIVKIKV